MVEKINIFSLKFNFKSQSKIEVNDYVVDINERKITKNNNELKLTEREIEIILFLNKKETPQNVDSLQTQIWKQKKELETHTVETHIYRLRKKINEKFNDNNFIKSNEVGYFIGLFYLICYINIYIKTNNNSVIIRKIFFYRML